MRAPCLPTTLLALLILLAPAASAETPDGEEGLWFGASLTSRILLSGVQAGLGVSGLLGEGLNARFDLAYLPLVLGMPGPDAPPSPPPLFFELGANALGHTARPPLDASLSFVAYGGGGPRLLALLVAPSGVILGVGGIGGFELRYAQVGLFLEADASLALLGISTQGIAFGPVLVPVPKLSLGLNYHFQGALSR